MSLSAVSENQVCGENARRQSSDFDFLEAYAEFIHEIHYHVVRKRSWSHHLLQLALDSLRLRVSYYYWNAAGSVCLT